MTIFDTLITSFTNGLVTDVQTLVLGLLSIAFLVAAFDLISSRMYGFSPVDKISDYRKELEYRDFKRGLDKQAEFNRRYLNDSNRHLPVGPPAPLRKGEFRGW